MKQMNRYLSREIVQGIIFTLTSLLLLFSFFDVINQLDDVGKGSYTLGKVFLYVLLNAPSHIYELFPVSALIGSIVALAGLASRSEITAMRVAGLAPRNFAVVLVGVGLTLALLTLVLGELIVPVTGRSAEQMRLKATNSVVSQEFRSGIWLKDDNSFVNIREVMPDASLAGIKIYSFDKAHRLREITYADRGHHTSSGRWELEQVNQTQFDLAGKVVVSQLDKAVWVSVLNPDILSVVSATPEQMTAWNLAKYVEHLRVNGQKTTRYEIALWVKLIYPLGIVVMLLLALPFAFQQVRAGGMGTRVFLGIMVGLGVFLFNRLFSHMGLIYGWSPVLSAALPTLILFLLALLLIIRQSGRRVL